MSKILFVTGFSSGGTDLVKNIINAHPEIYIASEISNLANIGARGYNRNTVFSELAEVNAFQRLLRDLHGGHIFESIDYDFSGEMEQKGTLMLEDVVQRCLSNRGKDALVWGAKVELWQIAILSSLFPSANFLLITRDVRDVCLSWRNKWGKDMVWCAAKWAERMAKGWELAMGVGSDRYLVVKFEDLLTAAERSCRDICEFLKIPFSDRMPNYHMYTDHWDGKRNYGQPIITGNKEKWRLKLTKKTIKRIEEISLDTMKLLRYPPEYAAKPKPIHLHEKVWGVLHDSWAILFIGNRAHSRNTLGHRMKVVLQEIRKLVLRSEQKKCNRL